MVRPKGFEPLTPWFVADKNTINLLILLYLLTTPHPLHYLYFNVFNLVIPSNLLQFLA